MPAILAFREIKAENLKVEGHNSKTLSLKILPWGCGDVWWFGKITCCASKGHKSRS